MNKNLFAIVFFSMWIVPLFFQIKPAQADDKLRCGALHFPPYSYVQDGVEPRGMLLDLAKLIFEKAKTPYVLKGYPPRRLYMNLASGNTDLTISIKNAPEYEGNVIFSRMPIVHIDLRLYSRPGMMLTDDFDELRGKRLITIHGFGYGGLIDDLKNPQNGIILDPSRSHESAFKKLDLKRGDYVLDYRRPASDTIKALGFEDMKSKSVVNINLFIVISKKLPNAEKHMAELENAYEALKQEGKIDILMPDDNTENH